MVERTDSHKLSFYLYMHMHCDGHTHTCKHTHTGNKKKIKKQNDLCSDWGSQLEIFSIGKAGDPQPLSLS